MILSIVSSWNILDIKFFYILKSRTLVRGFGHIVNGTLEINLWREDLIIS